MAELPESAKDWTVNGRIDHQHLLDKLSESMAVERGGQRLYRDRTDPRSRDGRATSKPSTNKPCITSRSSAN